MIINFDTLLKDLERERKSMLEIQEGQLEKYNSKDFKNFSVAPKIIVQVREFKK